MPIIQHLIADQFGSHVGKYQGRLKVTKAKEVLAQAPLLHLETVTISSGGVSISADAIRACTEHGIPIHFMTGGIISESVCAAEKGSGQCAAYSCVWQRLGESACVCREQYILKQG